MAYRYEVADVVSDNIEILGLVVEVIEFALFREIQDHVGPIPHRRERQQVIDVGVHSVDYTRSSVRYPISVFDVANRLSTPKPEDAG